MLVIIKKSQVFLTIYYVNHQQHLGIKNYRKNKKQIKENDQPH